MKIVYSYWNTSLGDTFTSPRGWFSPEFMLSTLVLSVLHSHKHYGRVEMVTDSSSKLWIEKLGLPFESIKTNLDELDKYDRRNWALGKIKAYSIQEEPFMHVDFDVILYNKLSSKYTNTDLFIQNFEPFSIKRYADVYLPNLNLIGSACSELPIGYSDKIRAANLGVCGCNNLDFNKAYCEQVFRFIDSNEEHLKENAILQDLPIIWEQYFWAALADKTQLSIGTILDEDNIVATESGYVHLINDKTSETIANNYIEHLKLLYHDYYLRINEMLNTMKN